MAEVQPIAAVVTGGVQPVGTAMVTVPPEMPPVAAVYVKAMAFCVEDAVTLVVTVVKAPVPSAAYTLINGDGEMLVSAPPDVDFSCPCQVVAPAVVVAVAPSGAVHEPPEVAP